MSQSGPLLTRSRDEGTRENSAGTVLVAGKFPMNIRRNSDIDCSSEL